jgi:hypothetical protein
MFSMNDLVVACCYPSLVDNVVERSTQPSPIPALFFTIPHPQNFLNVITVMHLQDQAYKLSYISTALTLQLVNSQPASHLAPTASQHFDHSQSGFAALTASACAFC